MAITIDYQNPSQYVINVPRADMTLVSSSPTEVRELDIDAFRLILNDLMDDELGIVYLTNHRHTAPLTVAGVTLARVVEILDPYVLEFEDGAYNVNVTGGNSNIGDKVIKNQVGVNTANSAGLVEVNLGSGLSPEQDAALILILKLLRNRRQQNPANGQVEVFDDDSVTVLLSGLAYEDIDATQTYRGQGADRIDRLT